MPRSLATAGVSNVIGAVHFMGSGMGQLGVADWIMVAGQVATVVLAIVDALKKRRQ